MGPTEAEVFDREQEHNKYIRRGYKYSHLRCAGRILFNLTSNGQPFIA